jgi:hypothetical protein
MQDRLNIRFDTVQLNDHPARTQINRSTFETKILVWIFGGWLEGGVICFLEADVRLPRIRPLVGGHFGTGGDGVGGFDLGGVTQQHFTIA